MSSSRSLNSASLNLVRPELSLLVKQAQGAYETAREQGGAAADGCLAMLRQASGVLRFIELPEAAELAAELARVIEQAPDADAAIVATGFALLARYLDYLATRKQPAPELLHEALNALRTLRRAPPLAENHFGPLFARDCRCPGMTADATGDAIHDLLRKLRHMYQIGLVGVVRGRSDPVLLRMMQRAAERAHRVFGGGEAAETWWLLGAVLEGFVNGELRVSPARSRLLSRADRQLKALLVPGALAAPPATDDALRQELLFLVAKCRNGRRGAEVQECVGIAAGTVPTDAQIEEERALLQGPSMEAIDALAREVREQLQPIKDQLDQESGAGNATQIPVRLRTVAALLRTADMHAAADAADAQAARVDAAFAGAPVLPTDMLPDIAEALLFVESSVDGLLKSSGMLRSMRASTASEATAIMARSILDEARILALAGACEGIEAVKRDVSSYVDGGQDAQVLAAAPAQMAVVRGVLSILGHQKASQVAAAVVESLPAAIGNATTPEARAALAESLADILICLEYYMNALANDENPDPVMLRLAEESLATLWS